MFVLGKFNFFFGHVSNFQNLDWKNEGNRPEEGSPSLKPEL